MPSLAIQRAVAEHEELDAQHADVPHRFGDARRGGIARPTAVSAMPVGTVVTARMRLITGYATPADSRPQAIGVPRATIALISAARSGAVRARRGTPFIAAQAAASSVMVHAFTRRRSRGVRSRDAGQQRGIDGGELRLLVSISAYAAQGTPQRRKCAFSSSRSGEITASTPGATGAMSTERDQRDRRHVRQTSVGIEPRCVASAARTRPRRGIRPARGGARPSSAGLAGSGSSTAVKCAELLRRVHGLSRPRLAAAHQRRGVAPRG